MIDLLQEVVNAYKNGINLEFTDEQNTEIHRLISTQMLDDNAFIDVSVGNDKHKVYRQNKKVYPLTEKGELKYLENTGKYKTSSVKSFIKAQSIFSLINIIVSFLGSLASISGISILVLLQFQTVINTQKIISFILSLLLVFSVFCFGLSFLYYVLRKFRKNANLIEKIGGYSFLLFSALVLVIVSIFLGKEIFSIISTLKV